MSRALQGRKKESGGILFLFVAHNLSSQQFTSGRGPLEASSLSFPLQNTVRNLTKINCSKQNFQHVPLLGSFTGFLQQNRSGILFFLCYSLTLVSVPRGLLYLELLLAHFLVVFSWDLGLQRSSIAQICLSQFWDGNFGKKFQSRI